MKKKKVKELPNNIIPLKAKEGTPISKTSLQYIIEETEKKLDALKYNLTAGDYPLPENVKNALNSLKASKTIEEAEEHSLRAYLKLETHLLVAWGNGKIEGKVTAQSIEAKIKSTKSLIKMLQEKGLINQVENQKIRLGELQAQLASFNHKDEWLDWSSEEAW